MSAQRKNIMLGTAGHVDHGKTALVKMLTGCDTDTLAEEKQRGLTIDLGFAPCRLSGNRVVGIVDVPGHVDFIRNMVAGAHGIDVVILVVAADDGLMPQTREHLQILTLMGLQHGLVVLTKTDLVSPERQAEVTSHIGRLLEGGFLAGAPVCPVSNVTGEGFDLFFEELNRVVDACRERPSGGLFRVWVEDVFSIRGAGAVITGIPSAGRVRIGDELSLVPGALAGHVRQLQVYGQDAPEAQAGECVAMNLPEIGHQQVRRGQVLVAGDALEPVTMIEAELRTLATFEDRIKDSIEVHLHLGTASALAHVAMLERGEMAAGETQMVQLRLNQALAPAAGDRFVIRASVAGERGGGLATIGGGRVLGTGNVRLRRRKPWTLQALAARSAALGDPTRWCDVILQESPVPTRASDLERKCLLRPEEGAAALAQLAAAGQALKTPFGDWLHRRQIEAAAARMIEILQGFHAANPQRAGMAREELCAAAQANPVLASLAADSILASGRATVAGAVLALAGWKPQVADLDQQLSDRMAAALREAGWAPPAAADLASRLREPLPRIEKLLRLLTERGLLVRLDPQLLMHRDAVEAARQVALRLFAAAPSFTTMQFRDALGVSRKFAVPLLDHLDRLRVTVRAGHNRTPGAAARPPR